MKEQHFRAWHTGQIVKGVQTESGEFGVYVLGDLGIWDWETFDKYWEPIPQSEAKYLGMPQTNEQKKAHSDYFWANYPKRRRWVPESADAVLGGQQQPKPWDAVKGN